MGGFNFKYYFAHLSSFILALLFPSSYYKFVFSPIICIFFPYKKGYFSLSLSKLFYFLFLFLVHFFFFNFSYISTLEWWIFVLFLEIYFWLFIIEKRNQWKIKHNFFLKKNVYKKVFTTLIVLLLTNSYVFLGASIFFIILFITLNIMNVVCCWSDLGKIHITICYILCCCPVLIYLKNNRII